MKLYNHTRSDSGRYHLNYTTEPSRFLRIFGVRSKMIQFTGSCTVWYNTTNKEFWKRCGTMRESYLEAVYTRLEHERTIFMDRVKRENA